MKYYVYWISPRCFANEGDYVYGLEYWIDQELGRQGAGEVYVSEHRTERAAMIRAIKEARRAIREYKSHDTVSIGARKALKEQTQAEWEAIHYGPKALQNN